MNEMQMKKLLTISAEYAKINKKDVFQTTVNIVSALNGQSQAVQALGIKLNQTAVQQFAYKEGINRTVASMTDNEKIQLRYNKLLTQYSNIAGIAAESAGTLADQNERYELNLKRISTALGAGATIIEQNNILSGAANLILNNLNDTTFKVAGAVGALGARFLQVGGFILEWTFKLWAAIKAVKILGIVLSSQSGINFFAANIPIINRSLNVMFTTMSGGVVQVKSLQTLMAALFSTMKAGLNNMLLTLTGFGSKGFTIINGMKGAFSNLIPVIAGFGASLWAALAPLLPIIGAIAAVVAVGALLWKALQTIEKHTKIFSTTWAILSKALSAGSSIFDEMIKPITKLKDEIVTLAYKGFGVLVKAMTSAFGLMAKFAASNPFNIFGAKTVEKFKVLDEKMSMFSKNISSVGYDIRKIDSVLRAPASKKSFIDVNLEKLAELRSAFKDFGKSTFQIIKDQEAGRLALIEAANAKGLVSESEFQRLKGQITKDAVNQTQADY